MVRIFNIVGDLVYCIQSAPSGPLNKISQICIMIVEITDSRKPSKRFCVRLDNGKTFDFGLKNGSTYIDNHDKRLRSNYWKRHLANRTEHERITNLVPSNALFSAALLWGDSTSLNKNIQSLNHFLSLSSKDLIASL